MVVSPIERSSETGYSALPNMLRTLKETLAHCRVAVQEVAYCKAVFGGPENSLHSLLRSVPDQQTREALLYCFFSGTLERTVASRAILFGIYSLLQSQLDKQLDSKERLIAAHLAGIMSFGDELADGEPGREQDLEMQGKTQEKLVGMMRFLLNTKESESTADLISALPTNFDDLNGQQIKGLNDLVEQIKKSKSETIGAIYNNLAALIEADPEKKRLLDECIQKAVYSLFVGYALSVSEDVDIQDAEKYYRLTDCAFFELVTKLVGIEEDINIQPFLDLVLFSQYLDDLQDVGQDIGVKVNMATLFVRKYDLASLEDFLSGLKGIQDTQAWPHWEARLRELSRSHYLVQVLGIRNATWMQQVIMDTESGLSRAFHTLVLPTPALVGSKI